MIKVEPKRFSHELWVDTSPPGASFFDAAGRA